MLQQRVVDGLLGRWRIGHVEQNHAVFVDAPAPFRADDGQAAVNRVARRDQVQAAPEVRLGDGFQPLWPAGKRQYGGNANQAADYARRSGRLVMARPHAAIRFSTANNQAMSSELKYRISINPATTPPPDEPTASHR